MAPADIADTADAADAVLSDFHRPEGKLFPAGAPVPPSSAESDPVHRRNPVFFHIQDRISFFHPHLFHNSDKTFLSPPYYSLLQTERTVTLFPMVYYTSQPVFCKEKSPEIRGYASVTVPTHLTFFKNDSGVLAAARLNARDCFWQVNWIFFRGISV